jgi:hypothetical protein
MTSTSSPEQVPCPECQGSGRILDPGPACPDDIRDAAAYLRAAIADDDVAMHAAMQGHSPWDMLAAVLTVVSSLPDLDEVLAGKQRAYLDWEAGQ